MRLRRLPRAMQAVLRGGGPIALAVAVLRRAVRPLATFHTLVFFETVLSEPREPFSAPVPIEMHVVGGDEVALFRAPLEAAGLPWEEVSAQAARGDRCTVALSGGKVIHARWMSSGPA